MMTINKNKCVQITFHSQVKGVHVSSIVDEGIRAILNLFIIIFFTRRFHTHKKRKEHKEHKKHKKHKTLNNRLSPS